jgi:mannose-6-phosphate isomerase-like protein (cupin superfamily)
MIVRNEELRVHALPGIEHRTIAGHEQGVKSMEVWLQTMAPGAATPVHRHACEEVILVLSGCGEVTVEGETSSFGANSTLIVPPDVVHQIVNSGSSDLVLVAALGTAPVRVRTAAGEPLPVPWAAPGAAA